MAKTNYTSLGINTIGKNDADIECAVIRYTPITTVERDSIVNPVNGMEIYNADVNLLEGFIAGAWPAPLCALAVVTDDFSFFVTTVITDQSVLITSINVTAGIGRVKADNTVMNITSETFTAEVTIDEPSHLQDLNQFYDIILSDTNFIVTTNLRLRPNTNSGDAVIQNGNGGDLVTGLTIIFPYTMRLSVNSSGAFFADSQGNSGTLSNSGDVTAQPMKWMIDGSPRSPSGTVNMTLNAGGSAPIVDVPSGYVTWCNSQFCPPLSLSTVDLSGSQTTSIVTLASNASQITGTNLTPSVGNNTAAYESVGFTTSTDKVHIEGTFKSQTGMGGLVGIGFSDSDPFVGFGDVVTAVGALPSLNLLIDGFTGSPLATGVTMNADYAFSLDIDSSSGTSAYKDTQGNSGSLGVRVGYNNANPLFVFSSSNSGSTLNDSIVLELNAGATTDVLPTSGAVTPCQAS